MLHAMATDEKLELLKTVPMFAMCNPREVERLGMLVDEVDLPGGSGQPEASYPARVATGLDGAHLCAIRCHEAIWYHQAGGAVG